MHTQKIEENSLVFFFSIFVCNESSASPYAYIHISVLIVYAIIKYTDEYFHSYIFSTI